MKDKPMLETEVVMVESIESLEQTKAELKKGNEEEELATAEEMNERLKKLLKDNKSNA